MMQKISKQESNFLQSTWQICQHEQKPYPQRTYFKLLLPIKKLIYVRKYINHFVHRQANLTNQIFLIQIHVNLHHASYT